MLLSKTARQGVGYREVIEHLEGLHSLDETIELVKIHTRQLAKRQSTWFRNQLPQAPVWDPDAEPLEAAILRLGLS